MILILIAALCRHVPGKVLMRLFISYRRKGAMALAPMLKKALESVLGPDSVFLDEHNIGLGEYPPQIEEALLGASAVIALVGKDWVPAFGERDPEQDWVLHELRRARRADKLIVPVLLDRATAPAAAQLPLGLRWLADS